VIKGRYTIDREDLEIVMEFAKRTCDNHRSSGRSPQEIFDSIVLGKLGEFAYKSWLGDSISEVDLTEDGPDEGWDFTAVDNGDRIQIKTLKEETPWLSFSNYYWDRIIALQQIGSEIRYVGELTNSEARKLAKPSKRKGWYIHSNELKNRI
jgi:hypothetical protein